MKKDTAHLIDAILGGMMIIGIFTTDWDYLTSDEGRAILLLVYVIYAIFFGIIAFVTYLAYAAKETIGQKRLPPSPNTINNLKIAIYVTLFLGVIFIFIGSFMFPPGEGLIFAILGPVLTIIALILALYGNKLKSDLK